MLTSIKPLFISLNAFTSTITIFDLVLVAPSVTLWCGSLWCRSFKKEMLIITTPPPLDSLIRFSATWYWHAWNLSHSLLKKVGLASALPGMSADGKSIIWAIYSYHLLASDIINIHLFAHEIAGKCLSSKEEVIWDMSFKLSHCRWEGFVQAMNWLGLSKIGSYCIPLSLQHFPSFFSTRAALRYHTFTSSTHIFRFRTLWLQNCYLHIVSYALSAKQWVIYDLALALHSVICRKSILHSFNRFKLNLEG